VGGGGCGGVVVHAGDWIDVRLLDRLADRLQARASRLIGVVGNNDGAALRARLPLVARAEVGGVRIAVVHETGVHDHRGIMITGERAIGRCWAGRIPRR
jgi:predicted phosphodiesterase